MSSRLPGLVIASCLAAALPQVAEAQQCQNCAAECETCCPPSRVKIVNRIRRSVLPALPPQGIVVNSVPAMNVSAAAVSLTPAYQPVGFVGAFPGSLTAGSVQPSLNDVVAAAVEKALKDKSGLAAAAAESDRCEDPCGDIKKLQRDVRELTAISQDLKLIVHELARQRTTPTPVSGQ